MKTFLAFSILFFGFYTQAYLSTQEIDQLYIYDQYFFLPDSQIYASYDESCQTSLIDTIFQPAGYYKNAGLIYKAAQGNVAKIIILRDHLKTIVKSYEEFNADPLSSELIKTIDVLLKYDKQKMYSYLQQPSGLVNIQFALTDKEYFKLTNIDQTRLAIQKDSDQSISFNIRKLAERDYSIAELVTVLLHEALHWNKKYAQADKDAWSARVAEWTQSNVQDVVFENEKVLLIQTPRVTPNLFVSSVPYDKPRDPAYSYNNFEATLKSRMKADLEKQFLVIQQDKKAATKLIYIYDALAESLLEQVKLTGNNPLEMAHMFQWPQIDSVGLVIKGNGHVGLNLERSLVRYVFNSYLPNGEKDWRLFKSQLGGLQDLENARKVNKFEINLNQTAVISEYSRNDVVDLKSSFSVLNNDLRIESVGIGQRMLSLNDIEIHAVDMKTSRELIFIPTGVMADGINRLILKFQIPVFSLRITAIMIQQKRHQLGLFDRMMILSQKPQVINPQSNILLSADRSASSVKIKSLKTTPMGTLVSLQVISSMSFSYISLILGSEFDLVDASGGTQYISPKAVLRSETVARQYIFPVSGSSSLELLIPDDALSGYSFADRTNSQLVVQDFGRRVLRQVVLHYEDGTYNVESTTQNFTQCNVKVATQKAMEDEMNSVLGSLGFLDNGQIKSITSKVEECSP